LADVHAFSYAGALLSGVDEFGTTWSIEQMSGWTDGVALRVQREARSQQDGEWDVQPLRAAREVTLMGKAEAVSHAALEQSQRRFTALPLTGSMTGSSDEGDLTADGYLSEAQRFQHLSGLVAGWALTFVAPDPLLYGPPTFESTGLEGVAGSGRVWPRVWPRDWGVPAGTTPGAIEVPNVGTAAYWPRLRIDGPVDNPVVTLNETGDWVRYNGSLTAGQYLDIDCANRRVLLNGFVSRAPQVEFSGRFLAVPVGGGSMSWNDDSASPDAKFSVFGREGAWL